MWEAIFDYALVFLGVLSFGIILLMIIFGLNVASAGQFSDGKGGLDKILGPGILLLVIMIFTVGFSRQLAISSKESAVVADSEVRFDTKVSTTTLREKLNASSSSGNYVQPFHYSLVKPGLNSLSLFFTAGFLVLLASGAVRNFDDILDPSSRGIALAKFTRFVTVSFVILITGSAVWSAIKLLK